MTRAPDIRLPGNKLWRRYDIGGASVWCAGAADRDLAQVLVTGLASDAPLQSAGDIMRGFPHQFAMVAQTEEITFCAVDRIRSIPLIWSAEEGGTAVIAQCGTDLFDGFAAAGIPKPELDKDQALAVAMSGYTVGPHTLYQGIHALLPGQCLYIADADAPEVHTYWRYRPWLESPARTRSSAESSEELAKILLRALRDTVRKADGRCIAVPLSAGLDSRYVASGLKELGYDNVLCFSYGQEGNREAQAAQKIAQELGYRWVFHPYELVAMRKAFGSADYQAFIDYSDSLTAVHFPQDFVAVSGLLKDGTLPPDTLMVNGQSGDFLTGNHIPTSLAGMDVHDDADTGAAVEALLKKHFALWGDMQTTENRGVVGRLLATEFDTLTEGGFQEDAARLYGLFEASEFIDRQSKYVVNGQRSYEQLGLDWDLPLWHGDLIDFYETQPLSAKVGQKLYRDTLLRLNWRGVWRDIPVNPTRLRPWWLPPVRTALKMMHAPLGRAAWHRFERRYLDYFMSTLCAHAVRDWIDVARDTRNPRSAIAYHVEDYLERHGMTIDEAGR